VFRELSHSRLGLIFEETVSVFTPVVASDLYMDALRDFEQNSRFALLGPIVTQHLGGVVRDPRAVDVLVQTIKDHSSSLRMSAAEIMAKFKDPRAVDFLVVALNDKAVAMGIRQLAAEALGEQGDLRAVEPLIVSLNDKTENRQVRQSAAEALGRIGDTRAVESLISALSDDSYEVRRGAVTALDAISDVRSIDALIALSQTESYEDILKAAREALRKMQKDRKR
jgi:HEAT repeat protein